VFPVPLGSRVKGSRVCPDVKSICEAGSHHVFRVFPSVQPLGNPQCRTCIKIKTIFSPRTHANVAHLLLLSICIYISDSSNGRKKKIEKREKKRKITCSFIFRTYRCDLRRLNRWKSSIDGKWSCSCVSVFWGEGGGRWSRCAYLV